MLSDRRQLILRALIEEYVLHAMPVGSRTLTEQYHLGVSSATVRNELSALEEAGLITQPHTSAGRIPTDAGYRQFVDGILASQAETGIRASNEIASRMRQSAQALDDLMERASAELMRLTDCLSIISTPSFKDCPIRQISLISLSNRQCIVVVVLQDSQVLNRTVAFEQDVTPEQLSALESFLANVYQGRCAASIDSTEAMGSLENDIRDSAAAVISAIESCIEEMSFGKTQRTGFSSLMKMPEFHETSSLLPLMEVMEDDSVVFRVFEDAISSSPDLTIRIGQENSETKLKGVSVIAGVYGRGDAQGVVAVIGPKRMNYNGVINAVQAAKQALSDESPE